MDNWMELTFPSLSVNEGFARAAAAAFAALLNPTIDELSDLRTAVSEAVTNAIIHAYGNDRSAMITLRCETRGPKLRIIVKDTGCGIEDIELARRPFYTSKPELERSGMGFAVMEAFMDSVEIESAPGEGTAVTMEKEIGTARGESSLTASGGCSKATGRRRKRCSGRTCPWWPPSPAGIRTAALPRRTCCSWAASASCRPCGGSIPAGASVSLPTPCR